MGYSRGFQFDLRARLIIAYYYNCLLASFHIQMDEDARRPQKLAAHYFASSGGY